MSSASGQRFELLDGLSASERVLFLAMGRTVVFTDGQTIIEEGSLGDGFYLLSAGSVAVFKQGHRLATMSAGDFVGEMALFHEGVRTSEVRAIGECTLLAFPAAEFRGLVLRQDPAAVKVMAKLGQVMVRRLQERDVELLRRAGSEESAPEELAGLRKRLLADWALKYHALGRPGKLVIAASKPVGTAADLSVAYSPGVAEPCLAIKADGDRAFEYTAKGHLVGVITNGTAVLGLGNIGALAAKPVMEGKAVLFKRFADLDAFDLEVDERDPARFIEVVCAVAPTFGGINLEDIRAPECFEIEEACKRRLDIPVFHDDQHGTAIIAGAGLLNALEVVDKAIASIRVVFSGAGAAGFACARYFLTLGVLPEHLILTDVQGVVYRGRGDGNYLDELAAETDARTLADAVKGADVFVGVSAPNVFSPEMLRSMARDPIVFALANPVPEIDYRLALATRPDVVMATGRSDYPNQINNVIAFPYIFRGALDTRARAIGDEIKLAATRAIAALAHEAPDAESGVDPSGWAFGREALIPKPFDRRLLTRVAPAVAEAAMASGSARIRLDLEVYRQTLARFARESV